MTLGMGEVARKRKILERRRAARRSPNSSATHMVPVVVGPGGQRYLIDHHHLARALHDEGVDSVFVTVIGDLGKADPAHFWNDGFPRLDASVDEKGQRRAYAELPKTVEGLKDDPYRSLSGALRRQGGFARDSTPFSEFVWAEFSAAHQAEGLKRDFAAATDGGDEARQVGGRRRSARLVRAAGAKVAPKPAETRKAASKPDKAAKAASGRLNPVRSRAGPYPNVTTCRTPIPSRRRSKPSLMSSSFSRCVSSASTGELAGLEEGDETRNVA